jgi:raffinose/stachyose/melibiose transport system permease protein
VIVREVPSPTRLAPPTRAAPRRRSRRPLGTFLRPVVVVVLAAVTVGIPLWIALITSMKPQGEAQKPNLALPQRWQPGANYAQALTQGKLIQGLVNSLLVVLPSVALVLILGAAAAWVFARRKGKLVTAGYTLAVSGLLLPPAVITIVMELRQLGLANSRPGMIAVYTGMYLSTSIFFMTGFIRGTIPAEIEEAARIDGAGPVRIFGTILLPMLRPVLATATIMVMLYAWSDVFYAFFVLGGGSLATAPLNLYQVANASVYLNNWHLIFAYVVLMSLPMIAVFLVAQRRIIAGITGGAVK